MIDFSKISAPDNSTEWFSAEVTHRQFASLSHKLTTSDIENEIINLNFFTKLTQAKSVELNEIEKWLKNSWNTENVLNQNKIVIESTGQSFAMQWAFPQAYYSTFASILALYKALGYSQESHTGVLKYYATLIEQNKFPDSISFYCTGGKKNFQYQNITKPTNLKPMDFDLTNKDTIDNHICQFLKSTREIKLEEKAPTLNFKTNKGSKRKNLTPTLWQQVSNSVGHTTIMDLLYRKRIKANYQDIDTFNSSEFKGIEVLSNLSSVVNRLNLVNEAYIAKAIGLSNYEAIMNRYLNKINNDLLRARYSTIQSIINTTSPKRATATI